MKNDINVLAGARAIVRRAIRRGFLRRGYDIGLADAPMEIVFPLVVNDFPRDLDDVVLEWAEKAYRLAMRGDTSSADIIVKSVSAVRLWMMTYREGKWTESTGS